MLAFDAKHFDIDEYNSVDKQELNKEIESLKSVEGKTESAAKNRGIAILGICGHFAQNINRVRQELNKLTIECNKLRPEEIDNDLVDKVYQCFFLLEDYVEFICEDFEHFRKTMEAIDPERFPRLCETLPQLKSISDAFDAIEDMVSDQQIAVISMLYDQLSIEQIKARRV